MAEPVLDIIECDPMTETCPEDFADGLTCDPDFEDCPEPETIPGDGSDMGNTGGERDISDIQTSWIEVD